MNACQNKDDTEINTSEKSGIHWFSESKSKIIIVCVIEKSPKIGNSNYEVTTYILIRPPVLV